MFRNEAEAAKTDTPKEINNANAGEAKVIGYTVIFDGFEPSLGVCYTENLNGARKVITSIDKDTLEDMRTTEWVGKIVKFEDSVII